MTKLKLANLEELRARYDFVGILAYFKSGELVVWCDKNGLSNESSAIKSLPKDLNEAQFHLKLYEIFNGANNTPQWLREYFKIFENWLTKQDELSALVDKALPLYELLKKNDYANNEAVENEIELLDDEIYKIAQDADEIHWQSEVLIKKVNEQIYIDDNLKKGFAHIGLVCKLSSLYLNRRVASIIKKNKLNKIAFEKISKRLGWIE